MLPWGICTLYSSRATIRDLELMSLKTVGATLNVKQSRMGNIAPSGPAWRLMSARSTRRAPLGSAAAAVVVETDT